MQQPAEAIAHVRPELWAIANRLHLCKMISEFAHESLVEPILHLSDKNGWSLYQLTPPQHTEIVYEFRAKKLKLNHWFIDKVSLKKKVEGKESGLDSLLFVLEFRDHLEISDDLLPGYLEEITSTLYGSMFMQSRPNLSASELVQADYQTLEHAMTSGHPSFVANNGRIGFDTTDYRKYAPEADAPVRLLWLAGHKSRTSYNALEHLPYRSMLSTELGEEVLHSFDENLKSQGLDPSDYYYMPVHPWQWYNKLAIGFAPDIANKNIVLLGEGKDDYFVQQSLRTLYNISHPEKFYTKTSLSILNMGFVRGMSPHNMLNVPPIASWIKNTVGKDEYLHQQGFIMLCEVASVGYTNSYYERFGRVSAYNKMLAALWRESPASVILPGQRLMTMAALLHVDFQGKALLPELIAASGLGISEWLRSYIKVYLSPLLHCFFQHDLAFMPHGENLILVLENHVPVKAIMKDITEEICVFRNDLPLPETAKRICVDVADHLRMQHIFVSIFDGYFRFLTQILVEHCDYADEKFWELVAECVSTYQEEYPGLREKFERFDLFATEFTRSCLNRLQIKNNKQMMSTSDPLSSLQLIGILKNPIAAYKKQEIEQ